MEHAPGLAHKHEQLQHAARRASPFSCRHILQYGIIKLLGQQLPDLGILIFENPQAPAIGYFHATESCLVFAKSRFRNSMLAENISRFRPGFVLLQSSGDLFFRKP